MKETDLIKRASLLTTIFIVLVGCILYYINSYGIQVSEKCNFYIGKFMFLVIGLASLVLCILYVKRMRELE